MHRKAGQTENLWRSVFYLFACLLPCSSWFEELICKHENLEKFQSACSMWICVFFCLFNCLSRWLVFCLSFVAKDSKIEYHMQTFQTNSFKPSISISTIDIYHFRDVARNFEYRLFGPNSPKLLGPLKKIRPLYLVHINTRTLYFYTQCVTWALFIMQTSLAICILRSFAPSQACIFWLCRNTKGFSMILSCHMFNKCRGFKISAAFLWKRIFAPCFTTQATEHCPILINEPRV